MANPLYNALFRGAGGGLNSGMNIHTPEPQTPQNGSQAGQMDFQNRMRQLQENPAQTLRQAGYNVPDEIANNPQAAVMHLLQSGQIGGPLMQKIQPMLNMLTGRK